MKLGDTGIQFTLAAPLLPFRKPHYDLFFVVECFNKKRRGLARRFDYGLKSV